MTVAAIQVPGIYRRRVGDVLVTALNDGSVTLPTEALPKLSAAEREALLRKAGRRPPFDTSVNAFLLQWPDRTVLVDTGVGKAWGGIAGKLPANMAAAGIAPGDVSAVLLTHMHVDHVGGLLDDAGAPVFPQAELWVAADEFDFWQDPAVETKVPATLHDAIAPIRRAVAPYGSRLRRFAYGEVMPGLEALAMPGHTPGHTGFLLTSAGERLLIWGDVMHVPHAQMARPDVGTAFDTDPVAAERTRRAELERAVAEDLLVTGMHMSFPGFCRIARAGDAYVIQAEVWQADV